MKKAELRAIPAVEKVLQSLAESDLPRPLVVALVRREIAALRKEKSVPSFSKIIERLNTAVADLGLSRIQPVINGTGVIIHTNLGRSPLATEAVQLAATIAAGYSNLELDLISGGRGKRATYLEQGLALLCKAEAATVVNNCAAALVLILRHFTRSKPEVIISRGELVQIGGGFRIPEILEASGARLREVGTTNRTTADDYGRAIGRETAMILKVHRSNFFMRGFVGSPTTLELAEVARKKRIPFVEDLGSGALIRTEATEPTPTELLRDGVDLVCFSGDKLLGGPQAGIIAGKARLVAALKREPFFRALRCDKLVLSALQATVELYLSGREREIPTFAMMRATVDELSSRAARIAAQLGGSEVSIGRVTSQVGGGTLPQAAIPSIALELSSNKATRLRRRTPPILGYIERGRLKLDLRTVLPSQDAELVAALRE